MAVYPQFIRSVTKTASYTVKKDEVAIAFNNAGAAGAVTFTLPPIADVFDGWWNQFMAMVVAQNMAVTAPTGKLVAFNNIAATTVTLSTLNNIAGSGFRIRYDASVSLYVAEGMLGSGSTVVVTVS